MVNIRLESSKDHFLRSAVVHFHKQVDTNRTEFVRKGIHLLIALVPMLAAIDKGLVATLLAVGTLTYTYAEKARLRGYHIPLISTVTAIAARDRDRGRFVLGPVTLGLGAMLALLFYPNPAASAAIYALAFGDGFAGLIGRLYGRLRPAFLFGKSLEGSAACFVAVIVVVLRLTGDVRVAFFAALTATLVEALPINDFDNIFLPMSVGLVVEILPRLG